MHSLCNQLLLEPSVYHFNTLQVFTDILKMCMKKFHDEKIFFDIFTAFLT